VSIEGAVVFDDFDQVAAAGGSGIAVVRSAIVTVADQTLDIAFGHVLENPSVKAIEVLKQVACTTNSECVDADLCNGAETCDDGHCIGGTPVTCEVDEICDIDTGNCLARGGPCETNDDCIGGEVCNPNTTICQPFGGPCDEDPDCVGEEICNLITGVCQETGGPCEDDNDCVGGEACNAVTEQCRPLDGPCDADEDCGDSQICIEGTCQLPPVCAESCNSVCQWCDGSTCASLCGNPFESETSETTAADALFALRTAVHLQTCPLCLCDIGNDQQITASDALGILRHAVHLPVTFACPGPPA
jgi:hypothetical protein